LAGRDLIGAKPRLSDGTKQAGSGLRAARDRASTGGPAAADRECSAYRGNAMAKAIDPNSLALLADIGGTNARFAVRLGEKLGPVANLAVAEHRGFDEALGAFLANQALGRGIQAAVIGVAGPVRMGRAEFTNSGWKIESEALKSTFRFQRVSVMNDFEAVARALPCLQPTDLISLGGKEGLRDAPLLVLGPGTGLGVACLLPSSNGPVVFTSEAGHMAAPSWSRRTDTIIEFLRPRCHGRVSAERLLSGHGLENLHDAVVAVDGLTAPKRSAAEITHAAIERTCPASEAAVDLFFAMLGEVAGNLALAFGARGGVYVAGGIAPRLAKQLAASSFRARFEDKGRLRPYLEAIPCWLIMHPNPAFLGLETVATVLQSRDNAA
jgi:glucokinase